MDNPWGLVPMLASRLRDHARVARARAAHAALVDRIHADGWPVENYQFPFIADERRAHSTLLQRLMGLVDVRTDREVWMQYTSFVGPLGPGILWSYGPESEAIAVAAAAARPGARPSAADLALLALPVAGAAATKLLPNRRAVDAKVAAVMVGPRW